MTLLVAIIQRFPVNRNLNPKDGSSFQGDVRNDQKSKFSIANKSWLEIYFENNIFYLQIKMSNTI